VRTPLALPEDCGENVMVTGTLCPAAIVTGREIPVSENSALLRLADETVTLAPAALRLLDWLTLVPTVALPKLNVVGAIVSVPVAVPVPESETLKVELEAFDTTVMPPLTLAADCGANTVLKVTLAPGLSASGTVSPLMLNPVPVAVACEIVTLDPPVFVIESVKVTLLPIWALPKARLAGLAVSVPAAAGAGLMVSVRLALPVPPLLVALSVTVDVAAVVGVPEINPDVLLTDNPAGNPVAP